MNDKQHKVVTVIPAYNEEGRVGKVVKAVVDSGLVDLAVVVDDGSSDATAKEAKESGATVLKLEKNRGKAHALEAALKNFDAEIYLFIDADLINLKKEHLAKLLEPLSDPSVGMVLGRLSKGRLATNISHTLTPGITGQRAVKKELAKKMPEIGRYGFGVELFLNDFCRLNGYRLVYVELEGLSQHLKEEKAGLVRGFMFRLKMYKDILKYLVEKTFKRNRTSI